MDPLLRPTPRGLCCALLLVSLIVTLLLPACGGRPSGPPRPVSVEVTGNGQRRSVPPGKTVELAAYQLDLTIRFDGPLHGQPPKVAVQSGNWRLRGTPTARGRLLSVSLAAEATGLGEALLTLDERPVVRLVTKTPALSEKEREDLHALALTTWGFLLRGETEKLTAMQAPEPRATQMGAVFAAAGEEPGLAGLIRWVERAGPVTGVRVSERDPWASMDLVLIETGTGSIGLFYAIPDRKWVKGLASATVPE
jgi:hypothetical protein